MPIKGSPKARVQAQYPEAWCVLHSLTSGDEYVIFNHGRINEGGYKDIGRGKSAAAAWKSVELK